jgi:hypothetical protein
MARWYRAYEGTISDPKLHEAALICGLSRAIVIACWHAILESCASVQNETFEVTPRRIALMLQEPIESINSVMEALEEIGLLQSGAVTSWSKRQYVSDNSTERVRKSREKKQLEPQTEPVENVATTLQEQNNTNDETTLQRFSNVAEAPAQRCDNVSVTTGKRFCNAPETETDTETKKEEENTRSVTALPENEIAVVAQKKETPDKRKRPDYDVQVFKTYWDGLIGQNGLKLAERDKGAQAKACWLLVDRTLIQFPGDAIEAATTILGAYQCKRSTRDKFWQSQPPTPLALSSQGVWGQVLESIRENRIDPEIEKLIESMEF